MIICSSFISVHPSYFSACPLQYLSIYMRYLPPPATLSPKHLSMNSLLSLLNHSANLATCPLARLPINSENGLFSTKYTKCILKTLKCDRAAPVSGTRQVFHGVRTPLPPLEPCQTRFPSPSLLAFSLSPVYTMR